MYKLKDEVNLKELKKFGFEYDTKDGEDDEWYERCVGDYEHKIFILLPSKEIVKGKFMLIFGYEPVELNEKDIQDLIDAGIVEEINEKDEI